MAFVANESFCINSCNHLSICNIYMCKFITFILQRYVTVIFRKICKSCYFEVTGISKIINWQMILRS